MFKNMYRDIFINLIAGSKIMPKILRFMIYRLYGINSGTRNINSGCFLGGNNINIGKNTFINYNCFFDNSGHIEIGENCNLAMEVILCTSTHKIGTSIKRASDTINKPIKIENGCWIGARAVILSGVTIGQGCIIAAGAIVTRDCEPNGLYAGVPAERKKDLTNISVIEDSKQKL